MLSGVLCKLAHGLPQREQSLSQHPTDCRVQEARFSLSRHRVDHRRVLERVEEAD